jgi:hypothetical protein
MNEILWDTEPVARQHHECTSCGRTINPGEKYLRVRIVSEDHPFTCKECAHCRAFVGLYLHDFCPDTYEGWHPEDVEQWEPETDEAKEHRRRFLIGWQHGRDLYPVPTLGAVTA